MFEKEAEEYAENREVCGLLDAISENLQNYDYGTVAHYNIDPLVEECFQDGANFGYNKAKKEMQKNGLALQSDMDKTIEQNISLKEQIEKMKCCHNCRKFHNLSYDCTCAEVCSEWELRGIKEDDRNYH